MVECYAAGGFSSNVQLMVIVYTIDNKFIGSIVESL